MQQAFFSNTSELFQRLLTWLWFFRVKELEEMIGLQNLKLDRQALELEQAKVAQQTLWVHLQTLQKALEKACDESERDALTGLLNHRGAERALDQALGALLRKVRSVAVVAVMIDLDGFKGVNDTKGHAVGDTLLRLVSERLIESFRQSDIIIRLGGDEFGVILIDADLAGGKVRAEAVLQRIERDAQGVTASIGIVADTVYADQAEQAENLISRLMKRADEAMYAAKKSGKNRISIAPSPSL